MKSVVFLVSEGGGNLKFFYFALKHNLISGIKLSVIADRECGALEFARVNDIANFLITYNKSDPHALNCALEKINPDVIVTSWHKIIDESTVLRFSGKLVNLHYSLLPAFSGLIGIEPIKRAYERNCKFIGPTCHLVDEGVDTGRILSQAVFTSERPFDAAITLMFRTGCLVLLSGVQQALGRNFVVAQSTDTVNAYSPELGFNESLFDESFWMDIGAG